MTIKGSPYDLSAANPLTPTVAQPVQPTTAGAFLGEYADMAPPMAQPPMAPQPQPEMGMAPQMAQPAQPAPGYDPESIAQVLQQAGLNYAPPQPVAAVAQAPTSDVNPPAVTTAPTQFGGQGLRMPAAPVAPVTEAGFGPQTTNVIQPGAVERPAEPVAFTPQTSNVANPAVAAPAMATSGQRNAADLNNPSGIGWNGRTWNTYDTPKAGVEDTQRLVSNYLVTPGRNTPEGFVGTWVTGDSAQGATVQNGAYAQSIRRNLRDAGVALNSDGTIPNTPEANAAITRAIIQHETAPDKQGRFAGLISTDPEIVRGGTLRGQVDNINSAYETRDVKLLYAAAASDDPQVSGPARAALRRVDAETIGAQDGQKLIDENKTTDLSRHLTSKNKEGSWIKYYLLNRLGLADMAREEAQLLGAGTKVVSLQDIDGRHYTAEQDGNGVIKKAWDVAGKEITSEPAIAKLQASALTKAEKGVAGATRVRDNNGTEWSVVPTARGSIFYDSRGNRGVPVGKTVPITVGGDVALQGQLQTQKKQIDLAWDPIIKAATTGAGGIAEYNIKYGTNLGVAGTNQQTGQPIIVDRNTNQVVNNTNGSATVTQTGAAGAPGTAGPNAQAQERAGANLTAMNKDIQDNLVPEARKADQQVNTINEMFSILKEPGNERVFGIYNGVMEGANARDKKLFSDFIAGKVVAGSPEYEDFRRRYSELGLTEDQVGVLRRMDALSAAGVGASVRELTGNVGISNQDVKIAQRNNVSVGEWPMLAAYSQLNYQRFEADLKRARAEWAADNMDRFSNSAAMDKAWRSESAQIRKDSDAVSEARAKYIRGYQSLGPTEKAAKIKQAYELYPPPRYQDGEWRNRRTGSLSSLTTRE